MPRTEGIDSGQQYHRETWLARTWDAVKRSFTLGPYATSSGDKALTDLFGAPHALTGVPSVTEDSALNLSAVWAAVTVISGSVASLPLILYKRMPDRRGKERMTWNPLYRLLHDEPNPEMTSMVFRETLQAHVLLWGNGYAEIERNGGGAAVALWPLAPNRVFPERADTGQLLYRVGDPSGGPDALLRPANVLHIPGLGFDGIVGYSVIRRARQSLGLTSAAEQFGARFFGQGAHHGGILAHPGKLSDAAHQRLQRVMEDSLGGLQRAHRLAILEEGMTWHPVTIPPDDAQFLGTREFQTSEVARWFGVPVHKLQDLKAGASYASIEQQQLAFVSDTLRPWLVRWEQEINRKLVPRLERSQEFAEHLVEGLLRGDIAGRYAAYAVGRNWGWLSANDIRERENMNPLPEDQGEIYLIPLNMVPADQPRTATSLSDPTSAGGLAVPAEDAPGESEAEREDRLLRRLSELVGPAVVAEILRQCPLGEWGERILAVGQHVADLRIAWETSAERASAERGATERVVELQARRTRRQVATVAAQMAEGIAGAREEAAAARRDVEEGFAARAEAERVAAEARAAQAEALTGRLGEVETQLGAEAEFSRAAIAGAVEAQREAIAASEQRSREAALAATEALGERVAAAEVATRAEGERAASAVGEVREAVEATSGRLSEKIASGLGTACEEIFRLRAALEEAEERAAARQGADVARSEALAQEAAALAAEGVATATGEHLTAALAVALEADRERARAGAEEIAALRATLAEAEERAATRQAAEAARSAEVAQEAAVAAAGGVAEAQRAALAGLAAELQADREQRLTAMDEIGARLAGADEARVALEAELRRAGDLAALEARGSSEALTAIARQQADLRALQDEIRAQVQAVEARILEALTPPPAPEQPPPAPRADGPKIAVMVAIERQLAQDAMRRMVHREALKARQASRTPEKLRAWMASFYMHRQPMVDTLMPVLALHVKLLRGEASPAERAAALIDAHCTESARQLEETLDAMTDTLELPAAIAALTARWEADRPVQVADALMREVLSHDDDEAAQR